MTKRNFSPLPTDDLNASEAWPFPEGADEVVVRVSRYADDGVTPAAYQALVRGRDRRKPWGIGIRSNPVAALTRAIECYFEPPQPGRTNNQISSQENDIRQGKPVDTEPGQEAEGEDGPSIDDLLG